MSKNIYFCTKCRKKIPKVDKLLFIDQSNNRGFCSEECILAFQAPYMEHFEKAEFKLREELALPLMEPVEFYYQNHAIFQKVLYAPDEIYLEKNEVGEEYFTHIYKFNDKDISYFYIIICSYYENEPSFVFFKSITQYKKLVENFKKGKLIGAEDLIPSKNLDQKEKEVEQEIEIPQEVMDDLELKKSEYLALLLESRSDTDIDFTEFDKYDKFLPLTLEDPDEIYQKKDEERDKIHTYIKSFHAYGHSFFYVVVCIEVDIKQIEDQNALLPVIAFPSIDKELYKEYATGKRLTSKMIS